MPEYIGMSRRGGFRRDASRPDAGLSIAGNDQNARGYCDLPRRYSKYDFVSRFFAPRSGIDEDPATDSTHCRLGPEDALEKDHSWAYQASACGGFVRVQVKVNHISLGGKAVTIFRGELNTS